MDKKKFVQQYVLNQSINRKINTGINTCDMRDSSIDSLLSNDNTPIVRLSDIIAEGEKMWDSLTGLGYGDEEEYDDMDVYFN